MRRDRKPSGSPDDSAQPTASGSGKYKRLFVDAPVALMECDLLGLRSALELGRLDRSADTASRVESGLEKKDSLVDSIRVVDANRLAFGCLDVTSIDSAESLLKNICARDSFRLLREMAAAMTGERRVLETDIRIEKPGGRNRHLHFLARFPQDDAGFARVMVALIDVTEKQLQEEQRRQSQKLEAIGQLASGIAHDFNNLLTVILGGADQIKARAAADPVGRELAGEIQNAAIRASDLTRQLLAFSRQQVLEPRHVDLGLIVAESGRMLRRLIPENIELVQKRAAEPLPIRADPGALEQMIVNLVVNARDAILERGKIKLATSRLHLSQADEGFAEGIPSGDYALMEVVDNGIGMTEEAKSRMFEPFFTTKPAGKGTGLGLSTVYGIARQSSAHIRVQTEVGNGTHFKVYLPLLGERAAPAAVSDRVFNDVPGGSETILVAEDESLVRSLVLRILSKQGYQPLEAADGAKALDLIAKRARPIHLLLTDVVMPGVGGIDLASKLLAEQPGAKVLFMSGYSGGALMRQNVVDQGLPLIEKPFTPEELLRKIREILDAP